MSDTICERKISSLLNGENIPVYVFDLIDSTNRFAKALTDDVALVVSNCQTSGRGRLGRSFFSPENSGIYMTAKFPVRDLYSQIPFITTLCAVGVHMAIKKLFGTDCGIKWVNDLYLDGKKLCGILCEVCDCTHAVLGIGINFYPSSLPEELKSVATYLTDFNSPVTRNELIAEIFNNISFLISNLPDTSFLSYYKTHSCVLGKQVLCIQSDNTFPALACDINSEGALVVKTSDGFKTLSTGEISIRLTD